MRISPANYHPGAIQRLPDTSRLPKGGLQPSPENGDRLRFGLLEIPWESSSEPRRRPAHESAAAYSHKERRSIAIKAGLKETFRPMALFKDVLLSGSVTTFAALILNFASLAIFPIWMTIAMVHRGFSGARFAYDNPHLYKAPQVKAE